MSEEKPPKEETAETEQKEGTPEKKTSEHVFKFKLTDIQGLKEEQQKQLGDMLDQLKTVINNQAEKIIELETKSKETETKVEQAEKEVMLEKMRQAGYPESTIEIYSKLDKGALQVVLEGLEDKDGKIIITKPSEDQLGMDTESPRSQIYDYDRQTFVYWDTREPVNPPKTTSSKSQPKQ